MSTCKKLRCCAPQPGDRVDTVIPTIDRVIQGVEGDAKWNTEQKGQLTKVLKEAKEQAERSKDQPFGQTDAEEHAHEGCLSVFLSSLVHRDLPTDLDIVGVEQYEDLDPGWFETFFEYATQRKVPFQSQKGPNVRIENTVRIAIAGDWGTGNKSSKAIAEEMRKLAPRHTIHLGDVYYSGTEREERKNFLELWAFGTDEKAAAFALNSNHEMYSGGKGYFRVALADPHFAAQGGASYFALENDYWLVCGLDSAYYSHDFMYQKGVIGEEQRAWYQRQYKQARDSGKKIILLTHHNALNPLNGEKLGDLWNEVVSIGAPDFWYWGHEHAVAVHKPLEANGIQLHARCIGHGGIPYKPIKPLPEGLLWAEQEKDPDELVRARNGFLVLEFAEKNLTEKLFDDKGQLRWDTIGGAASTSTSRGRCCCLS